MQPIGIWQFFAQMLNNLYSETYCNSVSLSSYNLSITIYAVPQNFIDIKNQMQGNSLVLFHHRQQRRYWFCRYYGPCLIWLYR